MMDANRNTKQSNIKNAIEKFNLDSINGNRFLKINITGNRRTKSNAENVASINPKFINGRAVEKSRINILK